MKLRLFAALAAVLLGAGCADPVPVDGFKDVNFGQSKSSLESRGYRCVVSTSCSIHAPTTPTMFGHRANMVSAGLKEDRVEEISVVLVLTNDEVEKLLTKKYGRAKEYFYNTLFGGKARTVYWLSKSGTSISMTRLLEEGPITIGPPSPARPQQSIVYFKDARLTSALVASAKQHTTNPDDI